MVQRFLDDINLLFIKLAFRAFERTGTAGRQVFLSYNANFRISRITLPDGSTRNYNYTGGMNDSQLINVTGSNGYNANYSYDTKHNMVMKEDYKSPPGYTYITIEYDLTC